MKEFDDDLLLGRLAVRKNFCTQDELELARQEQRRREMEGRFDHLGSILVEQGVLTPAQLERILAFQKEDASELSVPGYVVLPEIGRGAMGVVYRARQLSLDRMVALKVIPKSVQTDREYRQRFLREAKSAAALAHPHIIKAIDAGETVDCFYFAMELFEAPNLLQVLEKQGPFDEKTLLSIAVQIAEALEHARDHDLVHRDIKPENLLWHASREIVKITDMGLARSTSRDEEKITQVGSAVGTPFYMSPEMVRGESQGDIRVDLYSLGATLYHLAVGRPPFEADNAFLVLRMHLDTPLVPPRQIRPDLSEDFNRIVEKMMRKDPSRRYGSPRELLDDLVRLRDGVPRRRSAKSTRSSARLRKRKRKSSNTAVAVAASLAALAVLAGAVWFFQHGAGDGGPGDGQSQKRESPGQAPPAPPSPPGPDRTQETPPPPSETPVEQTGEEAFQEALAFAEAHPDQPQEAARRFERVGRRCPDVAEACAEKAALFRVKAREKAVAEMKGEVETLVKGKKYGRAINLLHAFPIQHRLPPDVAEDIAERGKAILARARSEARKIEREARGLFEAGRTEEALSRLETISAFEVAVLTAHSKRLIREFQKDAQRIRALRRHLDILDAVDRRGLSEAMAEREGEGKTGPEGRDLALAIKALEAAVEGARRLAGEEPTVLLRDGRRLRIRIRSAGKDGLVLEDPGDLPTPMPWKQIALETLGRWGGPDASGRALAALAWYLYRDAHRAGAFLASSMGERSNADAFQKKMADAARMDLARRLEACRRAIEEGRSTEARGDLLDLLADNRSHSFFRDFEKEVRSLWARAAKDDGHGGVSPFAFHGRVLPQGEGLCVRYDFLDPGALEDFPVKGLDVFRLEESRLVCTGGEGAGSLLSCPGRWQEVEAAMSVHLPEGGALRVVFDPLEGERTVLDVKRGPEGTRLGFQRELRRGEIWRLHAPQRVEERDGLFPLEAGFAGGEMWARAGAGKTVRVPGEKAESVGLRLEALGRFTVSRLEIRGVPERRWLESLSTWQSRRAAFVAGEAVEFAKKLPGGQWRAEGGEVAFGEDGIAFHGGEEGTRIWVPEARSVVERGFGLAVTVEFRRKTDRGYFFLTVPLDRRNVSWLVVPEREETPPAGAPKDVAVLSALPFSDGAWHAVRLEVQRDTATLYADGLIREMFATEDLAGMERAALKPRGLGFGAIGGRWEVRSFRVRTLR